jgi:carbamoylphosphate synthase large subunit
MTRDDIIRMAREAGAMTGTGSVQFRLDDHLERFAALVEHAVLTRQKARYYQDGYEAGVAAEREACAKLVENYGPDLVTWDASAPIVTTPHPAFKKPWVGLTEEEVKHIADSEWEEAFVRLIEAKLKELNT